MEQGHLDEVLAIEKQSFPSPWTRTAFGSHLQHPEFAKYFVARHGKKLVGYVGLFFGGGQGQITNLAVHPQWRRRKIGSRLLSAILEHSLALGLQGISLEVRVNNEGAQRMYEKYGFVRVGTRKNYYQETGEDAFVMCLFDLGETRRQQKLRQIKQEIGSTCA